MNFAKVLVFGAIAAVVIGAIMFFTRTDYTDPIAVATAFTKALRAENTAKASKYYLPEKAETWKAAADERLGGMKSGEHDRFFDALPSDPAFGAAIKDAKGMTTVKSSDNELTLGLTEVDGKWYVSQSPL
jgi:hypothetical protein